MTTVRQLIDILEAHAKKHGDSAPVGVYSYWDGYKSSQWGGYYSKVCRTQVYVEKGVLQSKGEEVK
jgi:hypothetical protein